MAQSRKQKILQEVQRKRRQRTIATVIIAAVIIAIIIGGVVALSQPKNEVVQLIPANVGSSANCIRPIHTHDASGTLHVETDVNRNYTLQDFFLIWGKSFNASGIFPNTQSLPLWDDRCVPSSASLVYHSHPVLTIVYKKNAPSTISMTVNGSPEPLMQNYVFPRDTNTSPSNIVITYGPGVPASF
ncbi:MAG TPA: hypothetical protein VFE98_07315 [Candidatus Bathyarchaeia archaeon]|nr:hypothetical protein [Candidatus Bathyarchaeia archaeon]